MHLYEKTSTLLTMQRGHTQLEMIKKEKKTAGSFQIYLCEIPQMQKWLKLQHSYQENLVRPSKGDIHVPVSKNSKKLELHIIELAIKSLFYFFNLFFCCFVF